MLHFGYKMAIGLDLIRNAGDLDRAGTMSCEQMVIDHELTQMLQRFWQGIHVDGEMLAVDAIRQVGPGGTFLSHRHTRDHSRTGEHYVAPLLYRSGGRPTLLEWAHARVDEILQSHSYSLPENKVEQLRRYVAEERRKARGS